MGQVAQGPLLKQKERLNVVWVSLEWPSPSRHTGGVGRYVRRLAEDMRHHVNLTVVTQGNPEELDGVRLIEVPVTPSRIDRYYRAPLRLNRIIRSLDADLIHAHGDDWSIHTRVPIVRSFHGTSWSEARTSQGLRRFNHLVLAALEHYSAWKAEVKLAIAPESMSVFRCDYMIPPLAQRPVRIDRDPASIPHVVFVGSYYGRKRGYLVQSAVEEARRALGADICLTVIGPADDVGNWDDSIHHLSGLTDQEVQQTIASAWVLVAPSDYEGFGIPVVEALDLGVPVIASATPGSQHIAETGNDDLPLTLVGANVEINNALIQRLQTGPILSAAERASALSCCDVLYQRASTDQLLKIYAVAVSR